MTQLYELSVGPVNANYYQQQFQYFESLGKTAPTWNSGAAFFTLAWLLARKLWGPALTYIGLVCALVMLWWGGIHGQVPPLVEKGVIALALLMLFAIPGYLANGLYYHHVRDKTIDALTSSSSLELARLSLGAHAVSKSWVQTVVAVQAAVLALGALWWISQHWDWSDDAPESAPKAAVGAPQLNIPAVRSAANESSGLPYHLFEGDDIEPTPEQTPQLAPYAMPAPSTTPPAPGKFYVSAGAYAQLSNAERTARLLSQAGIAFTRYDTSTAKGTVTSLRIGPFDSRRQAEVTETKARHLGIDTQVYQQPRR